MAARQESNIPATGRPKLRPLIPKPFTITFSTPPTQTPTPFCCPTNLNLPSDKSDIINTVPFFSTRWNPTTEQFQALEEMYSHGIRTPSAQQIQQIVAKLRGFGKIEGKNVFYWFQNHKARERQRKRRQLEFLAGEKRQSGVGRRYLETKHPKDLPTPTASSQECKEEDNWRQWNCKELQRRESCCWPLELVLSSCIQAQENRTDEFTLEGNGNHRTLDLFPVKAEMMMMQQEEEKSFSNASNEPNRFFEFLPTKNY